MSVPQVTAADVLELYNSTIEGANPVLADDLDGTLTITLRMTARQAGWYILIYRNDLHDQFPVSMSEADAQAWADQVNTDRAQFMQAALDASPS